MKKIKPGKKKIYKIIAIKEPDHESVQRLFCHQKKILLSLIRGRCPYTQHACWRLHNIFFPECTYYIIIFMDGQNHMAVSSIIHQIWFSNTSKSISTAYSNYLPVSLKSRLRRVWAALLDVNKLSLFVSCFRLIVLYLPTTYYHYAYMTFTYIIILL